MNHPTMRVERPSAVGAYPRLPNRHVVDTSQMTDRDLFEHHMQTFYGKLDAVVQSRSQEVQQTFDSYRPQSVGGESLTSFNIPADYDLQEVRSLIVTGPIPTAGTPATPAVPATGVNAQNPNTYPVNVVITAGGATITNVSVNGNTVGTAAGTYLVPSGGTISIAYSVATPTWVWSNAAPGNIISSGTPFTLQLGDRSWQLLLPVTGILTERFNPGIWVKQADIRQLTSATAGNWAVELTGYRSSQ